MMCGGWLVAVVAFSEIQVSRFESQMQEKEGWKTVLSTVQETDGSRTSET